MGNYEEGQYSVGILPGGVLQYLSYTGTCLPSGYGFSTVRSYFRKIFINRV